MKPKIKFLLMGVIFHAVNVIPFSANVMNLWWLKLDLPLSSGIVKAVALTSLEASATDEADAIIIMSKAKLVKKL
ncbi:hypothetical protein TNCT_687341 [Trichonephila clavata]|uniref:Uncharacterized protein n=1 Tax=Trichonephila clavata TaxID=2740835 RepID=A0A8X6HUG6_TRICU|nr:hypothetical protein TNCT_687341 [Trichonephila clavata]